METKNKTFSPKEITKMHKNIIRSYISGNITLKRYFKFQKQIKEIFQK